MKIYILYSLLVVKYIIVLFSFETPATLWFPREFVCALKEVYK